MVSDRRRLLVLDTRWRRAAVAWVALVAQAWPALALAQAQVEAVPEPPPAFEGNPGALPPVALPEVPVAPPPPVGLGLEDPDAPPSATSSNARDACRHFTLEERRLLPTLCGAAD
jgi:hypothetical protein